MRHLIWTLLLGAMLFAAQLRAQSFLCEETFNLGDREMAPFRFGPDQPPPPPPPAPAPVVETNPLQLRILRYAALAVKRFKEFAQVLSRLLGTLFKKLVETIED